MNALSLDRIAELCVAQLWQVTTLAVVVGLATRMFCRHRPHLAYLLWMLVLVKCLAPPVAASRLSPFSWVLAQRVERVAVESGAAKPTPIAALAPTPDEQPAAVAATVGATNVLPTPATTDFRRLLVAGGLGIWALGSIALALIVVAKWITLRRVVRTAQVPSPALATQLAAIAERLNLRRPVRIVVTDQPLGPLVFGVLRPTIVLPAAALQSSNGQPSAAVDLEPVLAHELVHVRRGDTASSLLQTVAQVLWWFHPLVWWANREVRRQRERACDEEVVAGLDCPPTRYARSLLAALEAAPHRRSAWAAAGVPMLSFTGQRLAHLVRESAHFNRRTPLGYRVVAIALLAMLLPGAGLSLEAPPEANSSANAAAEKPAAENKVDPNGTLVTNPGTSENFHLEGSTEITAEVTGQFVVTSQPVVLNEILSEAQRGAVAEIEKLGGSVQASRDKQGKVTVMGIADQRWQGNVGGLRHFAQIADLNTMFIACQTLTGDSLALLRQLKKLEVLHLDHPSDAQLESLAGWDVPTQFFVMGNRYTDAGLAHVATMSNLNYLLVNVGRGQPAEPPLPPITDAGIAQLNKLSKLEQLTMSDCPQITGATLGELAGLGKLSLLMINGIDLHEPGMAALAKLTNLKTLMLDGAALKSADYAPLARLTQLQTLSVNEGRGFDNAAAQHLAPLVNLKTLHLFDTVISDDALASLAGMSKLRQLVFWKGSFSDAGLAHLKGLTNLRVLRIDSENVDVGDAGLRQLAGLTRLQVVGLPGKRVTDEGLASLAGMTNMRNLELQYSQIRGQGLAELKGMTKLSNLDLSNTQIDDEGLKSLPPLPALGGLLLSSTNVTDAGLPALAALPKLGTLYLNGTKITDAGVPTLVKLPQLQSLDLSSTQITDASLDAFAAAKKLRSLMVAGSKVTEAGVKQFHEQHPDVAFRPLWSYELTGVLSFTTGTVEPADEGENEDEEDADKE